MERDQLPDEEHLERVGRLPARAEERLLGPDEGDVHPVGREPERPPEERRVRLRVRHDEVGGPERPAVDELEHPRGRRPRVEPLSVADERVVQRDERVEHDRSAARDPPRRPQVEVPRVPHDDDVRLPLLVPAEVALRARARAESCRTPRDQFWTPQTWRWRSTTSTPAPRRHETTCALRGATRSYVPK